jgi:hypothetical protein
VLASVLVSLVAVFAGLALFRTGGHLP